MAVLAIHAKLIIGNHLVRSAPASDTSAATTDLYTDHVAVPSEIVDPDHTPINRRAFMSCPEMNADPIPRLSPELSFAA